MLQSVSTPPIKEEKSLAILTERTVNRRLVRYVFVCSQSYAIDGCMFQTERGRDSIIFSLLV